MGPKRVEGNGTEGEYSRKEIRSIGKFNLLSPEIT